MTAATSTVASASVARITPELLRDMLRRYNLSRHEFIRAYGVPPLVYTPELPARARTAFVLTYAAIFALALLGNGVVLCVLAREGAARRASSLFMCSLALSDLLITFFCVPFTLLQNISSQWSGGVLVCKTVPFVQTTAIVTGILTMTCIAVERYQGIVHPLKMKRQYTPKRAYKMLGLVWVVSIMVGSPMLFVQQLEKDQNTLLIKRRPENRVDTESRLPEALLRPPNQVKYDFLYEHHHVCCQELWGSVLHRKIYTTFIMVALFLLPLAAMLFLYTRISIELWIRKRVGDVSVLSTMNHREISKISRKKKRAVKMMITIVLMFTICWAPFHTVHMLFEYRLQVVTVLFGDEVCTTLNMDQRKQRTELSQDIRKRTIDQHVKGKGYKTVSKQLDVPETTAAYIIQRFKNNGPVADIPGHLRRRRIDDRSKRRIKRTVIKEPRKTSKEIKGELQAQGASVSDRTIRPCLSQSGLNGRRPRTPLLKKPEWDLPNYMLTSHRASGRMSYGQMRQNCQGGHLWAMQASALGAVTDGEMKESRKRTGAVPTVEHGGGSVLSSGAVPTVEHGGGSVLSSGAVPTVEHGGGSVVFWSCPYCGTWRRLCYGLELSLLWNMEEALLCSGAVPTVEHGGGSVMFWSCPYCGTWRRLCSRHRWSCPCWNMVEGSVMFWSCPLL
ncbi:hypothetical protein NFI96_001039 [Prochilodus magdalenae]|nr:hypothetical protein NFI96_001039 [Prochilodus magdalenae]